LEDDHINNYLGDYDYYLEKKAESVVKDITINEVRSSGDVFDSTSGAVDYKLQKELNAQKRKRENELKRCEERIGQLEEENKKLEIRMVDPLIATSSVKLQEITAQIDKNNAELDELYIRWEELGE
nr:ABC transporter ATP-binding protein [Lachnospiraceae bacterium]